MPRPMTARYPGRCRECGGKINPGDQIIYSGKRNSRHASCESKPSTPDASPKPKTTKWVDRWVIDWPNLRDIALRAFDGNFIDFPKSRDTAEYYTQKGQVRESFLGYSVTEAKEWALNGYQSDALEGLEEFAPPLREKRRYIYHEDGDEIDLSAAWAGEDNFMTQWTKRDVVPGVSLEFEICFVCSTPARLVNEYQRWLARAVEAIEAAGIDPEISIAFPGTHEYNRSGVSLGLVRVKRENETVDLNSWSAMLSPATFRTFGFLTTCLQGERFGYATSTGISRGHGGTQWRCYYDPEESAIRTETPYTPHEFPEEDMTRQLREAIEELKRG